MKTQRENEKLPQAPGLLEEPGMTTFQGRFDKRRHGIGLLVEHETNRYKFMLDGGGYELALVKFVFQKSSGRILGILESFETLVHPGRSLPEGGHNLLGLYRSLEECRSYKLDLEACMAVIEGAELVFTNNSSSVSKRVAHLIPALGDLPWANLPDDPPWRDMGYWSGDLPYLCWVHDLEEKPGNSAGSRIRTVLRVLGQKSLGGPTFLKLLQGKLHKLA